MAPYSNGDLGQMLPCWQGEKLTSLCVNWIPPGSTVLGIGSILTCWIFQSCPAAGWRLPCSMRCLNRFGRAQSMLPVAQSRQLDRELPEGRANVGMAPDIGVRLCKDP